MTSDLTMFDAGGLARVIHEYLKGCGVEVDDICPSDPDDARYATFTATDTTGYEYEIRVRPLFDENEDDEAEEGRIMRQLGILPRRASDLDPVSWPFPEGE